MLKIYSTPAEALHIVNVDLNREINQALLKEINLPFDKLPSKGLATLLEEMNLDDMVQWACKSIRPVTKMEDSKDPNDVFKLNPDSVKLPKGFIKNTSLSFAAAGDLLYADNLEYSKNIFYENIYDLLFNKDLSYANFESPITTQALIKEIISDESSPKECCNIEQFKIIASHNDKYFDILNTSNNHIYDMGIEGIETTLEEFSKANIVNVGTNRSKEESDRATIVTKNGIKIGFVSYTFGLNGLQLPPEEAYRVNTANILSKFSEPDIIPIKNQIDDCKEQDSDFIITSVHWGYEFEFFPRDKQIRALRELAEHGSDAIICHHPHVIQPVEYYQTERDRNRIVPIAYSLGSLNWGFNAPHLALSLIQNLTITKGKLNGKNVTYLEEAGITPVFRSVIENGNQIITRIEKLDKYSQLEQNLHSNEYLSTMKKYVGLISGHVF